MTAKADVGGEGHAVATRERPYSSYQRAVALAYGIVCHALFGIAIATMIVSIFTGLSWGIGSFEGRAAWVANLLLVVQFPLLHSWLLSARGRAFLDRMAPLGLGRDLGTTSYATISSLQLLATFGLWSPSGIVWLHAEGAVLLVSTGLYAGSWLLLLKAMSDAGLDLQSGFRGWGAVVRNRRPRWKPFPTHGLYRFTRQPVYVAFFLTLWTAPLWTPDRLLLAAGWSLYCGIGPLFKERRCLRFEGERFHRYQSLVPYWLPSPRARSIPPLASACATPGRGEPGQRSSSGPERLT